jgi:hypothetical protein
MAQREIETEKGIITVNDEAGNTSFHFADDATPEEIGGPGSLVLMTQVEGGGSERHTIIIPAVDLDKPVILGDFFRGLCAAAVESLE